jgi:meso-butanediol dehydrogenase / (S,S)-butanediol dehydrogenase / diacetyl reductase
MNGRLEGKVAVLTGSGGDIARAIALRFAAEGAAVVGSDIAAELAEQTVAAVHAAGGRMASLHPLDLSEEANADRLAAFAVEEFGRIDIVCNNAKAARGGSGESTTADDWRFTLDRNLTLPWLVTRACIPQLRRNHGTVIFLASASGAPTGTGYPGNIANLTAYATAKAGVLRLAVALATELGPDGIRVNTISPGITETRATRRTYGSPGSPRHDIVRRAALLPRQVGTPEDIAAGALFLASDEASWITGTDLRIDGGWLASGGAGPARLEDIAVLASPAD